MATFSFLDMLAVLFRRELGGVRRSVEAYPDDKSLWVELPGMPNSGGTIALHLAGNLQHFLGKHSGKTAYVRQRDLEFSKRGVSRKEILAELDAAGIAIDAGFKGLTVETMSADLPEQLGGNTLTMGQMLMHMQAHLAYHLGQLDYHRRIVTGDKTGVNAVSVAELRPMK